VTFWVDLCRRRPAGGSTSSARPLLRLKDGKIVEERVCPANTTEVYRVFNNRTDANHRYVTDKILEAEMVASGWIAEGDGAHLVEMCAPQ
jgi:mRNA degradation ribonuclease J1/J2